MLDSPPSAFEPNRKASWLIFLGGLITGLACFLYYYAHHLTMAHYDAKAHLLVARRMIDSLEPGYAQMGVNWLPLIHIVYLPFVIFDSQYRSGLLPSLLSVLSYAVSGWLTYRIAHRLSGNVSAGVFAAIILLANPNLQYLQSCPLTEPLFMMLLLLSVDSFLSWRESRDSGLPWKSAIWVSLSALCRYEGWLIFGGTLLILACDFYTKHIPKRKALKAVVVYAAAFVIPMAAHFGYIYFRLGDNFFLRVAEGNPDPYLTYKRPILSVIYHIAELSQMAGIIPLLLAAIGFVMFFIHREKFASRIPVLLLWLPMIINIAALYWGLVYRLRYSVLLLPAAAIFGALAVASAKVKERAFILLLLLASAYPWINWLSDVIGESGVITLGPGASLVPAIGLLLFMIARVRRQYYFALLALCILGMQIPPLNREHRPMISEAMEHEFIEPERHSIINFLRDNYDGKRIMIDMAKQAPLVYDLGLNAKEFIYNEGGEKLWHRALINPAAEVGWLCLEQGDAIWKQLQVDPRWADEYALAVKTEHFSLYRLRK